MHPALTHALVRARCHPRPAPRFALPTLQACAALEMRHAQEVARLREGITLLERSERQLLKSRAVLEARASELACAAEAAATAHAAQLAAAEARLKEALVAAGGEVQAALAAAAAARGELEREAGELRARLGREARPKDVRRIAQLEGEAAELQVCV